MDRLPYAARAHRSSARTSPTNALVAGLTATATAATLAYATVAPASQIFGPVLIAPSQPAELALTFDDGPNPTATPYLLDLLAAHEVKATFFLIGRYALQQPALARRIVAEGHTLGNHTMTHPRLPLCSHTRITAELTAAQHALEDTVASPVRLFRPPHGYRTPHVLRVARSLGLTATTWNVIGNDWKLPSAAAIAARVNAGILHNQGRGRASNIALHDGSQTSPAADRHLSLAATATLLARGEASRVRFVTLEAWL